MRPRFSLIALVLLVLGAFLAPRPAAALFTTDHELSVKPLAVTGSLFDLPPLIEDDQSRAQCDVLCFEPLNLKRNIRLFPEKDVLAWRLFGPSTPTGPSFYAKARYYEPTLGRFISQDTFLGNVDDPPSLHRYFYANANPTRYIDPTGHQTIPPMYLGTDPKEQLTPEQRAKVEEVENFLNTYRAEVGEEVAERVEGTARGAVEGARLYTPWGAMYEYGARVVGGEGVLDAAKTVVTERVDPTGKVRKANKEGAGLAGMVGAGIVAEGETALNMVVSVEEVKTVLDPKATLADRIEAGLDAAAHTLAVVAGGRAYLKQRAAGKAAALEAEASTTAASTSATQQASTRIQTTVGNLRRAELPDAHHTIQDAAVRDLPGYNTELAPGTQVPGPSTRVGMPHYKATRVQRQPGGGTYAAERRIAYKALRRSGYSKQEALAALQHSDDYFRSIGVTPQTTTRIPRNRR